MPSTQNTVSERVNSKPANSIPTNPKSKLDKDAFLKLLIEQLKRQDPSSPMDTDKILSQTADLTVVESQQHIADAIKDMSSSFASSTSMQYVSAVGKYADIGKNSIVVSGKSSYDLEMYFDKDYKSGTLVITDVNGRIVRTSNLDEGTEGTHIIRWNGLDNEGKQLSHGNYKVKANYVTKSGETMTSHMGVYKIEALRLNGTNGADFKLGDNYYNASSIKEIKNKL